MLSYSSYVRKLVQKQEASQKRQQKIDKFISQFDKYEKGELKGEEFKEFLTKVSKHL
jgi:Ca2+-binding EF-hand superfamily protein